MQAVLLDHLGLNSEEPVDDSNADDLNVELDGDLELTGVSESDGDSERFAFAVEYCSDSNRLASPIY